MPPARFLASGGPTNLDLRIAAVCPTQLLQCLPERRNAGLAFGIVCGYGHKNTDLPHAITLLGPRRQRPNCCAAEQRDELAPPDHSITSSARASSEGGISRPSALAVLRLTTSSYLVGACTGRSAGFSPLRMPHPDRTLHCQRRKRPGRRPQGSSDKHGRSVRRAV